MANKRTLKHNITATCAELFAECVAASLYDKQVNKDNINALLFSIVKTQSEYICRVSHPEPGIKPSAYYKDLIEKFNARISEILDQISNTH